MPYSLRCIASLLCLGALAGVSAAQPKPGEKPGDESTISEVGGKTLDQWIKETKSADASVRENAVRTIMLFRKSGAPAAPALIDRLLDTDVSLRVNASLALGTIEISASDLPKVVDALARRVTDDRESIVRFYAAIALGEFGKEARAAVPKLINASRDPGSWEIRKAAVMALGKIGVGKDKDPIDMSAANALIYVLSNEATAQVRQEAAMALGGLGRPPLPADQTAMENALKRAVSDRDRIVQIWAAVGFMALTDKVPEEYLVAVAKLMKDEELAHRCHAARALGVIGPRRESRVPDLVDLLGDKDREAVAAAAWALGRIGDAKALPPLQAVMQRKETDEGLKQLVKESVDFIGKKK